MQHKSAITSKMKATRQSAPKNDVGDAAKREEMISVAAYYRAESRGFAGDDSIADWLAAEAEIDAMLGKSRNISIH